MQSFIYNDKKNFSYPKFEILQMLHEAAFTIPKFDSTFEKTKRCICFNMV